MSKSKKSPALNKIRMWAIGIVIILVLIKLNKTVFFLVFWGILAFLGKYIRGNMGLSMIVLDPNLFSMILIVKFLGIKELVIYLFFTILVADLATNIFSAGSFLNYVLYHFCPIFAIAVFGGTNNMMLYGNIASLMYSVLYVLGRTFLLPDDPIKVWVKAITSFTFTFLYITFFGPLFSLLMGGV